MVTEQGGGLLENPEEEPFPEGKGIVVQEAMDGVNDDGDTSHLRRDRTQKSSLWGVGMDNIEALRTETTEELQE